MSLRKRLLRSLLVLLSVYAAGCLYLYCIQESLLFNPVTLNHSKALSFSIPFEELSVPTEDGSMLSGALFKPEVSTRKLVFFLHGNSGNLEDQEGVAAFYTGLGYDFFSFDYRGYGKSTGEISSEAQFYLDARTVYTELKKRYAEQDISVIGYSIGSAAAAMLASENHPSKLVLMAPYYSMENMAVHRYRIIPTFLVSYKFATCDFLPGVTAPVCIFHGKNDQTIPYYSSKRLSGLLKKGDLFIPLEDQGHNGIENNERFIKEVADFLKKPGIPDSVMIFVPKIHAGINRWSSL